MNPLKMLRAKREIREMLLVNCATSQISMSRRMSKLQRICAVFPWVFYVLFPFILWERAVNPSPPGPYDLCILAYCAYVWHTSERELQLLRLIQHYREEEED